MSLKAFHLVFILLSIVLVFGFSAWLLQSYSRTHDGWTLAGCFASLLAGTGLILYGLRTLKKFRHVSYL
jgi:hypothetical protein